MPNKDEPIHKFIELAVNSITGYDFDFEQELKKYRYMLHMKIIIVF